jgi:hypothetical protein
MSQELNRFGVEMRAKPEGPYVAHFYCNNGDCAVRQLRIRLKYHGEEKFPDVLRCPVCQAPMLDDGILTLGEDERNEAHWARISVNVQRYKRDHAGKHGPSFVAVPATIYGDDSLPP